MKVRFKSKVTRGFSFSPLRNSCFHCFAALSQLSHVEKNQEKPLGPGYQSGKRKQNPESPYSLIEVAEHSFRVRFCLCNSACIQGLQKTNMPSIERLFYLLNTCTSCAIFLYNWAQCNDGFSLLLQTYVRKGNNAKNPAILSFFFVNERTLLNAAHA